jgi:hypothetical protein
MVLEAIYVVRHGVSPSLLYFQAIEQVRRRRTKCMLQTEDMARFLNVTEVACFGVWTIP